MSRLLEVTKEITRQQFIKIWRTEEQSNPIDDADPYARMDELATYPEQVKCYLATLTFEGLQNVIARSNSDICPPGGRPLNEIVQTAKALDSSTEKIKRLNKAQSEFDALKDKGLANSNYILGRLFCPRQLAVISSPDHFHNWGEDKFYAVNFHRFVAYGMWVAKNGFQPAKVYYCKGANCSDGLI